MYHGILAVNKEKGFTSHDVVGKLRGILKQKKIGHTGTLDPDAEGVLPVCLGNSTKVCDLLTDSDKTYEAVIKLGLETDTQDITGKVLRECSAGNITKEIFWEAAGSFEGEYLQTPPMYSALKVNGKKLYEYARAGIEVERAPRKVFIRKLELLDWNEGEKEAGIRVECSKGTYIRTLCHDIGRMLGCGGTMKYLLRTKAAGFCLSETHRLSEIEEMAGGGEEKIGEWIFPTDRIFSSYPAFGTAPDKDRLLLNGNVLGKKELMPENGSGNAAGSDKEQCDRDLSVMNGRGEKEDGKRIRLYDSSGEFRAVYELKKGMYYPVKMFL